ncbi:ABC transporter ATP-binding protein [Paenibacillus aquistagni]|uniref:ABC-2 type transport system ATP-binding protein n=1 Tax=Paenibacillus aquistagni TaxID=1852522 RepID=A0A1X7LNZ6_9BACL|nr:ATP-binding cassette domain-containing protein [Paenibacillus aquistagni]NMM53374.1 ATP-binding cassette domain-containing protein [Paenibacillus aquistagni]SMG55400.1 ABC-2 type transport system ATP-binding protein [Paenibacillus aquistagni]
MAMIRLENLSKHYKVLNRSEGLSGALKDLFSRDYRIVKAVSDLSLEVNAGEIVGFVGPNGAGKSTTIKMMTGVLKPTSGLLTVNGRIPTKNRAQNMQEIGVVFGQRTQLWWDLPVIESFKILRQIYRVDQSSYNENMNIFEELIDLKALYSTPVRYLSLGQRMLCDIVASFLHNPKVIFLDEPTIGLDISIKSRIREVIKTLNEHKQTTIILTTHDLSDIEALCKRIVIIDKGTTVYDGSIQKVSSMFGAHRTLKIQLPPAEYLALDQLATSVNGHFSQASAITMEQSEEGWIHFTINQDEVHLMDVLNYIGHHYPVHDIKIEEISIDKIVKNIYEGGLA